jgi:hypothetical protein
MLAMLATVVASFTAFLPRYGWLVPAEPGTLTSAQFITPSKTHLIIE